MAKKRRGRGRPKELEGEVRRRSISFGADHERELARLQRELGTTPSGVVRWLLEQSAARARS